MFHPRCFTKLLPCKFPPTIPLSSVFLLFPCLPFPKPYFPTRPCIPHFCPDAFSFIFFLPYLFIFFLPPRRSGPRKLINISPRSLNRNKKEISASKQKLQGCLLFNAASRGQTRRLVVYTGTHKDSLSGFASREC